MSAIANIVLADSVPVNHTFAPVSIDKQDVARWADRSGGIALGFPTLSQSLAIPTKTNRNYKLITKVVVPTLEVTSPSTSSGIQPAPTLAYNTTFSLTGTFTERSTTLQRKDAFAFFKNMMANAVVQNAVENFEAVY
jgi:hypothetical protein